jgi:hypothetical protein
VASRTYRQAAMGPLDWKLPEMVGRDVLVVGHSENTPYSSCPREPPVSNHCQKKTMSELVHDNGAPAALQGGRLGRTAPVAGHGLITYQSRGRQTWVKKQSQKVVLATREPAVGDGGVPADVHASDSIGVSRELVLEEGEIVEEDREAAIRWVDASDLLPAGDESEESGGRTGLGEFFSVALSEASDSDNTRASPTPHSPLVSASGSSRGPQLVQEVGSQE